MNKHPLFNFVKKCSKISCNRVFSDREILKVAEFTYDKLIMRIELSGLDRIKNTDLFLEVVSKFISDIMSYVSQEEAETIARLLRKDTVGG